MQRANELNHIQRTIKYRGPFSDPRWTMFCCSAFWNKLKAGDCELQLVVQIQLRKVYNNLSSLK